MIFPQLPFWIAYPIIFIGFFMSFFYIFVMLKREPEKPECSSFPEAAFIIPAKNVQATLEKCVKSVMEQDYDNKIEVIIVNDASTDNTLKIAHELAKKYNSKNRQIIILNREKSTGKKASAVNYALKYFFSRKNHAEYVSVLDADTFLVTKNVLKNAVPYFQDRKVMAVTSWMKPYNENRFLGRMQKVEYLMSSFFRYLLGKINALCLAPAFTLFRADFFKKAGYFNEKTLTEDFEMALRIRSYNYSIIFLDQKIKTVVHEDLKGLRKERVRWWHGTFQNMIDYRRLMSPKYGMVGTFFLPVTVLLGIIIMLAGLLIILYGTFLGATNFIHYWILGGRPRFDFNFNLFNLTLSLSDPKIILCVIAFLVSVLFFVFTLRKAKEKISLWDYLLFVFAYSWLLLWFCLEAVAKYIFKSKVSW